MVITNCSFDIWALISHFLCVSEIAEKDNIFFLKQPKQAVIKKNTAGKTKWTVFILTV